MTPEQAERIAVALEYIAGFLRRVEAHLEARAALARKRRGHPHRRIVKWQH